MKKGILGVIAVVLLASQGLCWAADDDRLAELEKKLEAMQAAYENRIEALENRIDELEGKPKSMFVPVESTAQSAPQPLGPVPETYSVQ